MAMKENDWFAINLLNEDVDALDLVANDINANNTVMLSKEHYKDLPAVRNTFKNNQTGEFDETAFDNAYNSALYTYNQMATTNYEDLLIDSIEKDPDYWFDTSAKIMDTSATISLSDDPYHRGSGLSGLQSISDPNWSVREIAQAQEATDENGVGLGWSPNDHALLGGSLKSLWQPTLAIASWDEDGTHLDADGNKISHKKGEYKLNKNGEFYYEKLGGRSAVGKEILRVSDTITVDGTQINKFDFFDADSIEKSAGGTIVRTALELAPLLIPGVNQIWGIMGAVYHTAEVMPTLAKTLNNILGDGEESDFGKSLNRAANLFKRFDSTQSDSGREKFMSFEQVCTQIGDIANQLYQQKFVGKLGQMLSQKSGTKAFENTSKLGQRLSTTYMAATSGMDSYEMFKEAGVNDFWAGIGTLAVMAGFYAFMSQDYYKDVLFGENSILNEEFVVRNTVKAVGEELNAAIRGVPATVSSVEARGIFQRIFNATKKNGSNAIKKIKNGLSKDGVGNALASAETKAAESTATAAAERLSMSKVQGMAEDAVKHGILGKSDSGSSWFNIMLNRASNEAVEEMMEEAMQDVAKALTLAANGLGLNVKDEKAEDIDFGFSFEDFFTRYLTAGIGGFVGGSLFAGLDKWEKIWSPNMREITSKGLSNGERIAYIIKEGGKENLLDHITKLEKKGVFGSTNLSYKGTPYVDMNGKATWNFQATEDPEESQNAMVAKGLRAYVNYIEQTMGAYDHIMMTDKELSKILRNTDEENREAVEVLKRDHPFTYKQLEKEAAKRNKNRDPRMREWTVQDMYETYNYADGVVRALDKCGYFQDFYHDYLMLGTKLIGLKYNLDKQAQDYKLAHPNDNSGWESSPTKKRIEEKIKDIEKQRDSILNGEKNADYIQRAIYMAWDPINRAFTEIDDENSKTLAEASVYNYAMSRYNIDFHDPDLTAEEKEQLTKEFEDYKKLKDLEKIRSSYDIFINLANAFNPAIESYIEEDINKPLNPLFSSKVNADNAQAKIEQLKTKLAQLQEQLTFAAPDSANDTWDDGLKNRFASIFQNLGIKLANVTWVDDIVGGAVGYYDVTANKFVFKKGQNPEDTVKTIIHEAVGHYGLRQLLNGPMQFTFQKQIHAWLKELKAKKGAPGRKSGRTDAAIKIYDEHMKYKANSATSVDNFDLVMHILYAFADESVRNAINEYGKKGYTFKDDELDAAIEKWSDPDFESNAKSELRALFPTFPGGKTTIDDDLKNTIKATYTYKNQAVLVEEYLAELAAKNITEAELSKSEKSWIQRIVEFFKDIFGLRGSIPNFDENFFLDLVRMSKDALHSSSKQVAIIATFKQFLNPTIDDVERARIINTEYAKMNEDTTIDGELIHMDPGEYGSRARGGNTAYPSIDIPNTTQPGTWWEHRPIKCCENISELIECLKFGTTGKEDPNGGKANVPFIVFGNKNVHFRENQYDIRGVVINTKHLSRNTIDWIKNKIQLVNSNNSLLFIEYENGYPDPLVDDKARGMNFEEFKRDLFAKPGNENLKEWYEESIKLTGEDIGDYLLTQVWLGNLEYKDGIFGNTRVVPLGASESKHVFIANYWLPFANFNPEIATGNPKDPLEHPLILAKAPSIASAETLKDAMYVGEFDNNSLFANKALYEIFEENIKVDLELNATPEDNAATYEMSNIQQEINLLDTLTVQSRQLEIEDGVQMTNALHVAYEGILNPNGNLKSLAKGVIESLQEYANKMAETNTANPNMAWVYEQLNYLKSAIVSRLRYEILSQIATETNTPFAYWSNWDESQEATITSFLNNLIDADLKNDTSAHEDANEEFEIYTDNLNSKLIDFGLTNTSPIINTEILNTWREEIQLGDATQTMLESFAEESKALYKFYELLNFDRLGDTIKLSDWINLALKGTAPEDQVRLQDYAMESSDFNELAKNIELTQKIVRIMIDAAHCNNPFGFNLFGLFNLYAKSDFYNFIGDNILERVDDEFEIFANKMNFLGSIAGLQSERQIKVQKEIAKSLNHKLMYRILNTAKIFNVDIPELWEKAGGQDLSTYSESMSDDKFAEFFKAIKKFEHLLYDAVNNDPSFTSKSDEEKIKSIFALFDEKGLKPGTINEHTELSDFSVASYLYSILTVDSKDFYQRLSDYGTANPDAPTPFSSQIFAIRLGDAYLRDERNGFSELSKLYKQKDDCFLDNLMTIFGSAGTGKTTVIANVIVQINPNKTIYYSANGKAQLEKLKESISKAKPENTFILQQLVDEIAPDWQTNYIAKDSGYALYNGVVKNSATYDDKLKNNVLIVDECTRLDIRKWQAISQYAKINNLKIIALGDLKQSSETKIIPMPKSTSAKIIPLFTDVKSFTVPILTESIRAANQAQRTNMLIFGKQFDTAINILSETLDVSKAMAFFRNNPFTLKYTDVSGQIIGSNITDSRADLQHKLEDVIANLKDDETIAIVTDSDTYNSMATADGKVEIVKPTDIQGREWTYVFSDFKFNKDNTFLKTQELYTLISRSKLGTLILADHFNDIGITFIEDPEGNKKIAANKNQFNAYGTWMKGLLSDGTTAPTPATTSSSSSTEPEDPMAGGAASTSAIRKRIADDLRAVGSLGANPDDYIEDIDGELVTSLLSSTIDRCTISYNGKAVIKHGNLKCCSLQFGSAKINFEQRFDTFGVPHFVPVLLENNNIIIDKELNASNLFKAIGTFLDSRYGIDSFNDVTTYSVESDFKDAFFAGAISADNAKDALSGWLEVAMSENLTEAENLLKQGERRGDEKARTNVKKIKDKLQMVMSQVDIIDDNVYVKKLANDKFGENIPFRNRASSEQKQKAVKIIADLVKLDARRINGNVKYVKDINDDRYKFIKNELIKALNMSDAELDQFLKEVFNNSKTFEVRDTNIRGEKELYLVIEDKRIYIGEIRNAQTYAKSGYYKQPAGATFRLEFRRAAVTSAGRKRVRTDDLFKDGMFNVAAPAVVVESNQNPLLTRFKDYLSQHPNAERIQDFVEWMERNSGKTMQAYTNISYLDLTDPVNVYQIQYEQGSIKDSSGNVTDTYDYPYAYNDMYGDLMGIQRTVTLGELYSLSMLVKFAQTGYPHLGEAVQVAYREVTTQEKAIQAVNSILGGNLITDLKVIPETALKTKRAELIKENERAFRKAGVLLNLKNTEKIETLMFLAALQDKTIGSDIAALVTRYMQAVTSKGQNGILFFNYYENNSEYKGVPDKTFKLIIKRSGTNQKWILCSVDADGTEKAERTWDSAMLTADNLKHVLFEISQLIHDGEKVIPDANSLTPDFVDCHLSIQPGHDWKYTDKDTKEVKSGVTRMSIVDFFSYIVTNQGNVGINLLNLFKRCEAIYNTNNKGKALFRSGIYLETRASNASFISPNNTTKESIWKADEARPDLTIPYSTDIVKIYNPIRSITLDFIGTTAPVSAPDFNWNDLIPNGINNISIAISNLFGTISAKTKEEFISELNNKAKEVYENYMLVPEFNEIEGWTWSVNDKFIGNKFRGKSWTIVNDYFDKKNQSGCVIESEGEWYIFNNQGTVVKRLTEEQVEVVKNACDTYPEFKEMFEKFVLGKVDALNIEDIYDTVEDLDDASNLDEIFNTQC